MMMNLSSKTAPIKAKHTSKRRSNASKTVYMSFSQDQLLRVDDESSSSSTDDFFLVFPSGCLPSTTDARKCLLRPRPLNRSGAAVIRSLRMPSPTTTTSTTTTTATTTTTSSTSNCPLATPSPTCTTQFIPSTPTTGYSSVDKVEPLTFDKLEVDSFSTPRQEAIHDMALYTPDSKLLLPLF